MFTVKENVEFTNVVNKSKFICKLFHVNNKEEILSILNMMKEKYNDATHICYAYTLSGVDKTCDDGEPTGTAGKPILNVLKRNNLDFVLCVVVRYFGGVKLGTGGLVRAYSNSVSKCLEIACISKLYDGLVVRLTMEYDEVSSIDRILSGFNIEYKEYDKMVVYECVIDETTYDKLTCNKEILGKKKTSL